MTRVSLDERYDNRSVIEQIHILDGRSQDALDASGNAVAKATEAERIAGVANATSARAESVAEDASAVANGIDGKATQALTESGAAVVTANGAAATAASAEATANAIDGKAQDALDTSADAMTEASEASATALRNTKAIDASNVRIGALEQSEGQHDAKISTLQRDLNNVKAEYLDKFDLTGTQLIRSRTDFEKEPLIRTVSPGDVDKDDGRHAVNYATMKRDAFLRSDEKVMQTDVPADVRVVHRSIATPFRYGEIWNGLYPVRDSADLTASTIGMFAFENGKNVRNKLADVEIIANYAFLNATFASNDIESSARYIGKRGFAGCAITSYRQSPKKKAYIGFAAFEKCVSLKSIDLMACDSIDFKGCSGASMLEAFIIREGMADLLNANAFESTPIASGGGYIYVQDDLVEQYKAATNWVVYAAQIKPLSELPGEVIA